MKTVILLLVLALPGTAHAFDWSDYFSFDSWSKGDIGKEVAWQALHLVDWGQTLDIASQPKKYHELNPAMGKHPSRSKVNLYMAASALLHVGITHVLPSRCRPWFQHVSIGVSGTCVVNNFAVGLSIKF